MWNFIKVFLDENTARKVQITASNINQELVSMCAPSQLEVKYGGTQPNREIGEYWPPQFHDTNFGADEKYDIVKDGPADADALKYDDFD